jgi:hypothetical protein
MAPGGERIAILETKTDRHSEEILSLRSSRHELGNRLTEILLWKTSISEQVEEVCRMAETTRAEVRAIQWKLAAFVAVVSFVGQKVLSAGVALLQRYSEHLIK